MEDYRDIIDRELKRLDDVASDIRGLIREDSEDYAALNSEINELKRHKLDALDWNEKNQIEKRIDDCRARLDLRSYQDPKVLRKPYFGVLEIEDDDLGDLSYCFGVQSAFGRNGKVLVVDWREAPISRLYYEYDSGDSFEEDIRGRERSGTIISKRKVDTTDSVLKSIIEGDIHLVQTESGWKNVNKGSSTVLKESREDHRLPEITALISNNQFSAITQSFSRIFLLQGGAGSGKTTVGLHRISYLAYNHPKEFKTEDILVIVFNKSLQKYISGVLPSLNIDGVMTETYHRWAGAILRRNGISLSYNKEIIPENVLRFKKSSVVLKLVDRYIDSLIGKTKKWFLEKLEESRDTEYEKIKERINSSIKYIDLIETLSDIKPDPSNHNRDKFRINILKRLNDHREDLSRLLTDNDSIEKLISESGYFERSLSVQISDWQKSIKAKGLVDFADTAIMLYLLQKKGIKGLPDYSHIMIDEAQDLSEVEIATIIHAAGKKKSVTVCGDMAQKIKGDVSFNHPDGFEGYIKDLNHGSDTEISAEKFEVGYRASRQIMELAFHVLGEKPLMVSPRDGKEVICLKAENKNDVVKKIREIALSYETENKGSLLCIITRFRNEADQLYSDLLSSGLKNVRRHDRENFSFKPGIIVTNAHQIKGLEFSAVIIVNPSQKSYRDDTENRMLLHVAVTRASDQLWIVGDETPAYNIDKFLEGVR